VAQKVQVIVTCDLHDDDSEGVETIQFGFDGHDYELDLCAEHAEQVHEQLQGLISHARRAGRSRGTRKSAATRSRADGATKAAAPSPAPSDRERLKAIREWARANGHPDLSSRGRIPQAVVEQYDAAHRT
jgi:hypothetical protein